MLFVIFVLAIRNVTCNSSCNGFITFLLTVFIYFVNRLARIFLNYLKMLTMNIEVYIRKEKNAFLYIHYENY